MSVYDQVEIGGRIGQVKLWGRCMRTIHWGDSVPTVHGFEHYSVAMREGGYLHISNKGLRGWHSEPLTGYPVFDKYGRVFNEETQGELAEVLNDPYLFPKGDPDE